MLKKEYFIKGEYIADNGLILFHFIINNINCIQIDSFDYNTNKFKIEYLIEGLTHFTLNYFKENGIIYLLNGKIGDKIYFGGAHICNCYKLIKNEIIPKDGNPNYFDLDNIKNDKNTKEIISLLLHYILFKNDIREKISLSKTMINTINAKVGKYNYYLVNKKIISEFIDIFYDNKLIELINKHKILSKADINEEKLKTVLHDNDLMPLIKSLNNKIGIFKEKVKDMDFYQIDILSIKENLDTFYYPKDLIFLDEILFLKFLLFLELEDDEFKKKESEISLNFNYGNIVFKSNGTNFLNNKYYLIYVYSMDKESLRGLNFSLEFILSFSNYADLLCNFDHIICLNIKENVLIN